MVVSLFPQLIGLTGLRYVSRRFAARRGRVGLGGDTSGTTATAVPEVTLQAVLVLVAATGDPKLVHPTREPGDPIETYRGSGFFNSGIFFEVIEGAPQYDSYSLKFDTPGAYTYVCALHEYMKGTVIVDPPDANVPPEDELRVQAESEALPLIDVANWNRQLIASPLSVEKETREDGTSVFIVNAGIGPRATEILEFLPRHLTVTEGATVAWISNGFHSVVVPEERTDFPYYLPMEIPDSLPIVAVNPEVYEATDDCTDTGFFNSGIIGPGLRGYGTRRNGVAATLTFNESRKCRYICPIHRKLGMVGAVTVVPR